MFGCKATRSCSICVRIEREGGREERERAREKREKTTKGRESPTTAFARNDLLGPVEGCWEAALSSPGVVEAVDAGLDRGKAFRFLRAKMWEGIWPTLRQQGVCRPEITHRVQVPVWKAR